ncbi:MAG: lysophospholipid acyltransferase family protein [Syntrophales bacterium]|nr:lysophospholipid acyltransferase family protein [Syntrophales bacterium]
MARSVVDFIVTAALWIFYIVGYILFFSPFYLYVFFFSQGREETFQKMNHILHRIFFYLVRLFVPRVEWRISKEVTSIRSSIIIANHLSFLDPILFVSLFEKQKTIVKKDYFGFPVFGWILKTSGYIPSLTEDFFTENMMNQVRGMADFLASGGNLFIFPEGTRSRDGRLGRFDKGAFSIAKRCRAPIKVVVIRNTNKLYPPDRFLFNTADREVISVELAGTLSPDYDSADFSLSGLMAQARAIMEGGMNK